MRNKAKLVVAAILACGLWTTSFAVGIGGALGVGRIFRGDDGFTGFSACLDADIEVGPYLSISPTLGFWTHSEKVLGSTMTVTDIIPAVGFKLRLGFEQGVVEPFVGIQPEYHLLSGSYFGFEKSDNFFGASALAGVAFKVTPAIRVPVQFSYGLIFGNDENTSDLHFRVGVLCNL